MQDRGFVGREAQLQQLDAALGSALRGESVVCLVTGEPGAGKTSLLKSFANAAQQRNEELLVAYGACDSFTGTGDPYLPFREILKLLTGDVEQGVAEGRADQENASRLQSFVRMSGRALVENGPDLVDIFVPGGALLARLGGKAARKLPWTERLTRKVIDQPDTPTTLSQDNVFEQYTQVLEAMAAQRPLMLVVDDLHWADRASLGLLFHLARRLVNDPVLVLGAYRAEELSHSGGQAHPLKTIVAEMQRIYGDITIDLGDAGSPEFVDAVIDARSNKLNAEFRRRMSEHTAGNPLFMVELLQQLQASSVLAEDDDGNLVEVKPVRWDELPSRVLGVIEARMSHLSERQREILDIASVHGSEFYAEIIGRVIEEKRRTVVKELSGPLQKAERLVRSVGFEEFGNQRLAAYAFRHNLFQHYLYRHLDEVERVDLHGEIAAALEDCAGEHAAQHALLLARHCAEARQWPRAINYFVQAGDHACGIYAPADAVAHYEQALMLAQQHGCPSGINSAAVIEKLADQLVIAGRHDDAAGRYAEALSLIGDDALARSQLLRKSAVPHERRSQFDEAVGILVQAAAALEQAEKKDAGEWWQQWIEIRLQFCWIHYWRNEPDLLQQRNEELRPVVDEWGTAEQRASLLTAQIHAGLRKSRYRAGDELVELARQAGAVSSSVSDTRDLENRFILGFVLLWASRYEEAIDAIGESLKLSYRTGNAVMKARCVTYLSIAHRFLHQDEEVAVLVPQVQELATTLTAEYSGVALAQGAWCAWRAGDTAHARSQVNAALQVWHEKTPRYPMQWLGQWVKLALAVEDADEAAIGSAAKSILEASQVRPPSAVEQSLQKLVANGTDRIAVLDTADSCISLAVDAGLL